jgi:glycosyltransferase involved in cell wall biosynthesis
MTPISVVIITLNEETNIERCILSVLDIADEIIVLDSLSIDRTKEICLQYHVRFIEQPFLGYIQQKNKALEFAKYSNVLAMDADEALSEDLKVSIKKVKKDWKSDGYYFNRLTNYCGKWIRHTDWYPDRKLRLFDKTKGKWEGINPHDELILQPHCSQSFLKGDLNHYSYPSINHHMEVIQNFSTISAQEKYKMGEKANLIKVIFNPTLKFFKSYLIKLGFLDGYYGFVICAMTAFSTFMKYVKLHELNRKDLS